jgi:DNA-binding XRE family transcriptional regulator
MDGQKRLVARVGGRKVRTRSDEEQAFLNCIGREIKTRRVALGITGLQMGQAVGVTTQTEYHRESGRLSMRVEDLLRYAVALECSPSDLVCVCGKKACS